MLARLSIRAFSGLASVIRFVFPNVALVLYALSFGIFRLTYLFQDFSIEEESRMGYGSSGKKQHYEEPSAIPSGSKSGVPHKGKSNFEKDLITESSENQIKTGESKGTSE
jgi:hypothetical protein